MSVSSFSADLPALADACGLLREECAGLERFLGDSFGELEQWCGELEAKGRELSALEARLSQRERTLDEQQTAVQQLLDQLLIQQTQQDSFLDALQTAGAGPRDAVRLSGSLPPGELSALRRELVELRESLPLVREPGDAHPADAEREELEAELDAARRRTAELREELDQRQRSAEAWQETAAGELRRLREALERQTAVLAAAPAPPDAAPFPPPEPVPVEAAGHATLPAKGERTTGRPVNESGSGGDPVLNSVMAQFARLQQQAQQRRGKAPPPA